MCFALVFCWSPFIPLFLFNIDQVSDRTRAVYEGSTSFLTVGLGWKGGGGMFFFFFFRSSGIVLLILYLFLTGLVYDSYFGLSGFSGLKTFVFC